MREGRTTSLAAGMGAPLVILLAIFVAQSASALAPPNDNFADAELLSGTSDSASGTNLFATKEDGEPDHAGHEGGGSVWWTWVAPQTGAFNVDTFGSEIDTLLAVYQGVAVDALLEIASNDDASDTTLQSSVTFLAEDGQSYEIAVDGFVESGNIQLTLNFVVNPPNDAFADAELLSGTSDSASGTNLFATKEDGEPNHAGEEGGGSVWWTWVAPQTGAFNVDTFGSEIDTLLAVYQGVAVDALLEIASNDDASDTLQSSVTFLAEDGQSYEIAVDGYEGESGNILLQLTVPEPAAGLVAATALLTLALLRRISFAAR